MSLLLFCYRATLTSRNTMRTTHYNLKFSSSHIENSKKEQVKLILVKYFYPLHPKYCHYMSSIQKVIYEIVYIVFLVLSLKNMPYILYFQHMLMWAMHIASAQQQPHMSNGYHIRQYRYRGERLVIGIWQMWVQGQLCYFPSFSSVKWQ